MGRRKRELVLIKDGDGHGRRGANSNL